MKPFLSGLAIAVLFSSALCAVGPYEFFPVTPCRIVDTRNATGVTGGPALAAGAIRNFPITGYCGIPASAQAAVVNLTMLGPTNDGFLTIWPSGLPWPQTSTINAAAGTGAIANGAIVPLTTDPNVNVAVTYGAAAGTVNVVIDVTGYFQ